MGAALTTLVAYAIFATLTFAFARRIYPLRLDVARLVAIGMLCVGAAFAARLLDGPGGEILVPGLLHGALVIGVGIALVVIVRGPLGALRGDAAGADASAADRVSAPSGTTAG
jgi:hypothetical protein